MNQSESSSESSVPQPIPPQDVTAPEAPPDAEIEARVPASAPAAPKRRAKTEDFAFLARLPARKPETFDADAIRRAAWMVGGLAAGLWIIMLIARPGEPEVPVATPEPAALMQQAPPIVLPANDAPPAPQVISLTPAPLVTPPPAAPEPMAPEPMAPNSLGGPGYGRQAPARGNPDDAQPTRRTAADEAYAPEDGTAGTVAVPTTADTPDPSNLFPGP